VPGAATDSGASCKRSPDGQSAVPCSTVGLEEIVGQSAGVDGLDSVTGLAAGFVAGNSWTASGARPVAG
jgi:hypothetical protein